MKSEISEPNQLRPLPEEIFYHILISSKIRRALYSVLNSYKHNRKIVNLSAFSLVAIFALTAFVMLMKTKSELVKTQVHEKDLLSMAKQEHDLAVQATFNMFLWAWQTDQDKHIQSILPYLGENSREAAAAVFLLDDKPFEDKLHVFRLSAAGKSPGFMDFVLGEYYRKSGKIREAIESYTHCIKALETPTGSKHDHPDYKILEIARSCIKNESIAGKKL